MKTFLLWHELTGAEWRKIGVCEGDEYSDDHKIEIEVEVRVLSYTPDRPAPACSNPSSPAFSDPGDPGEVEFEAWVDGVEIAGLEQSWDFSQRVYEEMEKLHIQSKNEYYDGEDDYDPQY